MQNPYAPLDQTGVVINDLDIGVVVNTIREQGYAVVENFLTKDAIAGMRRAFNTEVPITEMRAIGTETGRTWRAHNLLAKTRAADDVFLDPRLRGIVDGIIGRYNQINVTKRPKAPYHSIYLGAPISAPSSIKSKSRTKFKAAIITIKPLKRIPIVLELCIMLNPDPKNPKTIFIKYIIAIPPVAAATPNLKFSVALINPDI